MWLEYQINKEKKNFGVVSYICVFFSKLEYEATTKKDSSCSQKNMKQFQVKV